LKAILVAEGINPPLTHDLDAIREALPESSAVRGMFPRLASLSAWAVRSRYPVDLPAATLHQAGAAVGQAAEVLDVVLREWG
jgi:hypothetical protein